MNREHTVTEVEFKEIIERLTAGEASIKSAHHRIDELQEMHKTIKDLAVATAQIATETKKLREDYNKADEEIQELKEKPTKRYETVVTTIITALCSGIVGYALSLMLN